MFDEEMTRGLRENIQRRLIEFSGKEQPNAVKALKAGDEIATLRTFIEQQFVELYKFLPVDSRPAMNIELTFDASELLHENSRFTLNVPVGSSFGDVLNEIYFRIADNVPPFTYLTHWTLTDAKDNAQLSMDALKVLIPANLLLKSDRTYRVVRLHEPDPYLRPPQPSPYAKTGLSTTAKKRG